MLLTVKLSCLMKNVHEKPILCLIIQGCRKVCGREVSKHIKRIRFFRVSGDQNQSQKMRGTILIFTRRVEIVIDSESTCLSTLSSTWKSRTLFECPVCWYMTCHKGFFVGSSFYSQTFTPNVTQFAFILESHHSSNLMLHTFLAASTCLVNS